MAKRKTGIYRADITFPGGRKSSHYYYGRNADVVKTEARETHHGCTDVEVIKVGDMKYTVNEPVVSFTEEETKQIESYYLKEMIKYEAFRGKYMPS